MKNPAGSSLRNGRPSLGGRESQILISILIATRDNEKTIAGCLESVLAQTQPHFEVLVANDGSRDRTLEIARGFSTLDPRVRVISFDVSRGAASARNAALRAARGGVFVFLDADCVCPPTWLAALVAPLAGEEAAAAGGPDSAFPNDTIFRRCVDYSMHSFIGSGGLRRGDSRLIPYSPAGCNLAVRREVVEEIGMFDERLNRRGEDKEFEARLRRSGRDIVYVPQARIWHYRRADPRSFWRQNVLSGRARVDIVRTAPDAFRWPHFVPAAYVGAIAAGGAASLLFAPVRPLFLTALAVHGALLLIDGAIGAWRLRDLRAFWIVPLASAMIPLGYGFGTLKRLVERDGSKNTRL